MEAGSLRSGFQAEPTPQSFSVLVHHRQRLSSLDPPSCERSACHRWSRNNLDLGPACHTWGWHTWAVPEQPSWLRMKLHLEQLGGLSVRLPGCGRLAGSWRGRAPGHECSLVAAASGTFDAHRGCLPGQGYCGRKKLQKAVQTK